MWGVTANTCRGKSPVATLRVRTVAGGRGRRRAGPARPKDNETPADLLIRSRSRFPQRLREPDKVGQSALYAG